MTETTKRRKTPAERAQEDYDVALRVLKAAEARAERTKADAEAADEKYTALIEARKADASKAAEDLLSAQRRVAFLGTHPDLPSSDNGAEDTKDDVL